ncbi:unnamed protein product [Nippostrongylus brasiliensis]|uniref:SCP domain-containing protein n=1 Tax=Nippostrongylus brasiliensis TaxID=27835 RepID=A0A0N4YKS9_NIPBR|nr:unnamed protein product [Nippostrongylus brasiliensis]
MFGHDCAATERLLIQSVMIEKWNATEMACTYGRYNDGEVVLLICAYNVKGAVVGEAIYEESQSGKYMCDEGSPCGTNGTCTADNLCRVPVYNPDALLPIYTPSLSCTNPPFMNQFSRYYALNLHNYYRRLVASGWAESKLTQHTPRAARMQVLTARIRSTCKFQCDPCPSLYEALSPPELGVPREFRMVSYTGMSQSYECSLEEVANENVKKCEKQLVNKNSVDTGSNVHIIEDVNITIEAAIERAIGEWFGQLQEYEMDPYSSWTEDPTVKDCANVRIDLFYVS